MIDILTKKIVAAVCALFISATMVFSQQVYTLSSPNGKIKMNFFQAKDGAFLYSVNAFEKNIINPSVLGYKIESGESVPAKGWVIDRVAKAAVKSVWKPVWGKRKIVPDVYNEMLFTFVSKGKSKLSSFQIMARAYNDGVAFRYIIPSEERSKQKVSAELTKYNFAGDFTAWFYNGENHNIGPQKLSEASSTRKPVMTIKADATHFVALHEADLREGEPLVLSSKQGDTSFSVESKPEFLQADTHSAWRVILLGDEIGTLVDSHLIELLNPDPSKDEDFSWVKPSIALWDWRIDGAQVGNFKYTMTYPSWVKMVDFAAQQGFKYLVLDANWYGPEHEGSSDPVKGDKASDVQKLLKYAKSKGVGIWLYLNDVGGRKYPIEKTLAQYGDWGAAGVKYGFMKGTPAEKNEWTRKITKLCADNKLLVDFHDGPIHPYGQMRTFPNAVTREYCQAQLDAHKVFEPKTFVTSVFVNMLAGPIDMNNGMFDLRQGNTTRVDESKPVPSTLASEAARTLIVFSGATIIPDIPEFYKKYPPLLAFLSAQKMPWVDSKTLAGEIGEYIVMMRQTDDAFLIGAATNESPRELTIPLYFLGRGKYVATIVEDGAGADYLKNRETIKTSQRLVTRNDFIKVRLAAGGGACITLQRK